MFNYLNLAPSLFALFSAEGSFATSSPASVFSYACVNGSLSAICTWDTASRSKVQLTNSLCNDVASEWSYDGSQIAFERDCGNYHDIFKMNADGTGLRQVTSGNHIAFFPTWAPNGQIVYMQMVYQPGPIWCTNALSVVCSDLRVINPDGTGDRELIASSWTNSSAVPLTSISPHVSPDGATVIFGCGMYLNGWGGTGLQLCTIPFATGAVTQAPTLLTKVHVVSSDPHYSLSKIGGQYQVVFDSIRDANGDNLNVYAMNADGSNVRQLTKFIEPIEGQDAGYNASMAKIVFEHETWGGPADVWLMNADGSNQQALGLPCALNGCKPRFRPLLK